MTREIIQTIVDSIGQGIEMVESMGGDSFALSLPSTHWNTVAVALLNSLEAAPRSMPGNVPFDVAKILAENDAKITQIVADKLTMRNDIIGDKKAIAAHARDIAELKDGYRARDARVAFVANELARTREVIDTEGAETSRQIGALQLAGETKNQRLSAIEDRLTAIEASVSAAHIGNVDLLKLIDATKSALAALSTEVDVHFRSNHAHGIR